jgi:citrate synthase
MRPGQLNISNSASAPPIWTTSLSETTAETISIRGYDLTELIGAVPFPAVVHLLFTGELPDPPTGRLIDAVMVASIDHGAGAPSVLAARTAVSGGATLQAAAAAGLLTLGEFHGAAVDSAMQAIAAVVDASGASGRSSRAAADDLVADWRARGERIPGFGHRQHKRRDPRLDRLMAVAREAGVAGDHLVAAAALEAALASAVGKPMPINIDGMMAAILNEVGFPSDLGNALFIASRIAGILAHANEEQQTMTPMRRVDPTNHAYGGRRRRIVPSAGAVATPASGLRP